MEIKDLLVKLEGMNYFLVAENEKLILKYSASKDFEKTDLHADLIEYIKVNKDSIISYLSVRAAATKEGKEKDIESIYRLSGLQEGMLFHGLYDSEARAYIEQFITELRGFNQGAFEKSWQYLLERHSVLRTAFHFDQFKIPVQCVYRHIMLPINMLDYGHLTKEEAVQAVQSFEERDRETAFDFKKAPLMRLTLIKLEDDRYRMIWTFHHILFDGWSLQILMEELLSVYEKLVNKVKVPVLQNDNYLDYIRFVDSLDKNEEQSFWKDYLKDVSTPTLLPFIASGAQRTKGVGTYSAELLYLDDTVTRQVNTFAQQHRITVNTVIQGVWAYLLHRYTGNNEIVYGVIVSGRPEHMKDVERRVGMYINTLPFHASIREDVAIAQWLEHIQGGQVAARQHQYTVLSDIQRWIGVSGDMFDSLLVFENYPVSKAITSGQWSLRMEQAHVNEHNNYPLSITVGAAERINICFGHNTDMLPGYHVRMIKSHFEHVLLQLIGAATTLADLNIITQGERERLMKDFQRRRILIRPELTSVLDLINEQCTAHPSATALEFDQQRVTYRELDQRANQLCRHLIQTGVTKQSMVPLCLDRSISMIVSILAVLKAGAAYVPIDPSYPQERIRFILDDIDASSVICNASTREIIPPSLTAIDADDSVVSAYESTRVHNVNQGGQLAYIIYTSGSTGRPKGVMIEHSAVLHLILQQTAAFKMNNQERILQFSNYSFDASVEQIFLALCNGATLVLLRQSLLLDMPQFQKFLVEKSITHLHATPSFLEMIESGRYTKLRRLIAGGELCKKELAQRWTPFVQFYNEYGPTETTVTITEYCCDANKELNIEGYALPIGAPLPGNDAYILDQKGRLVPQGVYGELHFGGPQLARGYLNQESLTRQKFIQNPFSGNPHDRLYKTGDIARWLADGNIEFHGRTDDQIKIRGYRIELGEIATVMQESKHLRQAVVIADDIENAPVQLLAYVVPHKDTFDKELFTLELKASLPQYMIPARIIAVSEIPLSPNGKIDRKRLLGLSASPPIISQKLPADKTEATLLSIWQRLLELENIAPDDDFFDLGGHSLLAIRVISAIRQELKSEIPIGDIFDNPTITTLAAKIKASERDGLPPIQCGNRPNAIPLSFSQERLWFIHQLDGSIHYHMPLVLYMEGTLDIEALSFALQAIVNRHEILRTVIQDHDGNAFQEILPPNSWLLQTFPVGNLPDVEIDGLISSIIQQQFDLSRDHMIRAHLLKITSTRNILVLALHHIVADGWSMGILINELNWYFSQYRGEKAELPQLQAQYADFAVWQRQHLESVFNEQLIYWKTQLADVVPLNMPVDFSRPASLSVQGALETYVIDKEIKEALQHLSQRQGTTLFMTLITAFKILLYRYSQQTDICVGTPSANRMRQEVEPLIGFFVNTLPIRSDLSNNPTFSELLAQVKSTTLAAYQHQDVPFEMMVEEIVSARDLSRSPIFQTVFSLENAPVGGALALGDVLFKRHNIDHTTSKFEMTFSMSLAEDGMWGAVEYSTDLYRRESIKRMIRYFKQLLVSIVSSPGKRIDQLELLTREDQRLLDLSSQASHYPFEKTMVDLFHDIVLDFPDKTAVISGEESISYKALNERSDCLAAVLQSYGVGPEQMIPVYLERSVDMIVALLAILKAGGAYVPIDPAYPDERIRFMIEETKGKAGVVVGTGDLQSKAEALIPHICFVDITQAERRSPPAPQLDSLIQPQSLAYVMYTSGSSGKPKGVMVEHRNVVSLVKGAGFDELNASAVLVSTGSPSFDATIFEYWGMLLNGGTLVLCSNETLLDGEQLEKVIKQSGANLMWFTSSYLNILVDTHIGLFASLKIVIAGGEALSPAHITKLRKFYAHLTIVNGYGPTENTTFSLRHNIQDAWEKEPVPIGRPLLNRRIFVYGPGMCITPPGMIGELFLAGDGVARGYLNDEVLTKQKFIQASIDGVAIRLYRSGDLVRLRHDGELAFVGRNDDQVKINGHRIEPAEIRSKIQESGIVLQNAVIVAFDQRQNRVLVAYVVLRQPYKIEALKSYLHATLPYYLIPSHLVEMKNLPLTPHGKIDKQKLLRVNYAGLADQIDRPLTEIERNVLMVWKECLKISDLRVHDNFFNVGGNSILMIQVVNKLKCFQYVVRIRDLFSYQTIETLAAYIGSVFLKQSQGSIPIPHKNLLVLQQGNKDQPIFIIPGSRGASDGYVELAEHLGNDFMIYGMQMQGLAESEIPLRSISEIAAMNVRLIRKLYPEGPYNFLGHSFGAHVAFEMCKQLEAESQHVNSLILLDIGPTIKKQALSTAQVLVGITKELLTAFHVVHDASRAGLERIEQRSGFATDSLIKDILDELDKNIQKRDSAVEFMRQLAALQMQNALISLNYSAQGQIDSDITIVKAEDEDWSAENVDLGWSRHGNVRTFTCPGTHATMITTYSVQLADIVKLHMTERSIKIIDDEAKVSTKIV